MGNWSDEETDNPLLADDRNFYKVEKWTKDDQHTERMLRAGNSLDKAREISKSNAGHASGPACCSAGRRRHLNFEGADFSDADPTAQPRSPMRSHGCKPRHGKTLQRRHLPH